jgi:prepilin-type N-terminal cleavage/methylation domain-containing protein
MRAHRGFTLIELMVVVSISLIVGALVIWQGRSARQAAGLASGAYELALRLGGLKARAMADGREYVAIVVDAANAGACRYDDSQCGRVIVVRNPQAGFTVAGFDPDAPIATAEFVDDSGSRTLPRNSQLDLTATWSPPAPFNAILPNDSTVLLTCGGSRRCFGIRFRPDGDVRPVLAAGTTMPGPGGFAFVLKPYESPSRAADRRGIFISFPAGLVKTAAF